MKLFGEEVNHTSTNSPLNILKVENFEEIFFDVFEVELNDRKLPLEKISEYKGNPVVSLPVIVEGKTLNYPFVLMKGKQEIIFNESSSIISEETLETFSNPEIEDSPIIDDISLPTIEENLELVESKKEILSQIEKAKGEAEKAIQKSRKQKIRKINEESQKSNILLDKTLETAREKLVDEFILISDRLKSELVKESKINYSELKETLDNKLVDICKDLESQLRENFDNASNIFDRNIKSLVKELYLESVSPKVEKELKEIAHQIVEKVSDIETGLDKKLEHKADKTLIEGVSKELLALQIANIELNDNINKGVNKALSRSGNVKILAEKIDKELTEKISKNIEGIEHYFNEKIQNIQDHTIDITEESRKYIIDLVNKSKVDLLEEIKKIQTEKPVEYIIESNKKDPEKVNVDKLKKEYDKVIHDKFENYKTDLRKYIAVYSGGGSVAQQFAAGGTMNGNLVVTGSISSSEYLGLTIPNPDLSQYLPLSGGILTGSLSTTTLSAGDIYSNGNTVATVVDPVRTTLTGNDSLSSFAISGANNLVNPSTLIVAIDGALQEPGVDYTVATGIITFTSPIPNGSKAVVISPTNTLQVSQMIPADGSVTSAKLGNNIEIAGQLTAPNQELNGDGSVVNRDHLYNKARYVQTFTINNFANALVASGSSGAHTNLPFYVASNTPSTINTYHSMLIGNGFLSMNPANDRQTTNFSKRIALTWDVIVPTNSGSLNESRYLWPVSYAYTNGRLTNKGFGFIVIGQSIYGCCHDGTNHLLTSPLAVAANTNHSLRVESDGTGNADFYANGSLFGSLIAPTGTLTGSKAMVCNVAMIENPAANPQFYACQQWGVEVAF